VVGTWEVKSSCVQYNGNADIAYLGLTCIPNTANISGSLTVTGSLMLSSDGKYTEKTTTKGSETWGLDKSCLELSGTRVSCERVGEVFAATLADFGYTSIKCENASNGGCTCAAQIERQGGMGILYNDVQASGKYSKPSDKSLRIGDTLTYSYCVKGSELTLMPVPNSDSGTPYTGTIVLQKTGGGTGGSGGTTTSTSGKGGTTSTGGSVGGTSAKGGSTAGGSAGSSAAGGSGGSSCTGTGCGAAGSTGTGTAKDGPCDVYAASSLPCVTAYSTIRLLSKSYKGPLFQIRAGSSSTNNTMSGGTTKDISAGPDGFVDAATVDAACGTPYCTVSILYDQSGNENHLKRSPKGNTAGGATGAEDDYESCANSAKAKVNAGGHPVYALYMNKHEAYRVAVGVKGKNVPTGSNPQGTYMLADGTHTGTGCCWDFGNVTPNPATEWRFMDTLCYGVTWWGKGDGAGPWFMADFEGGVWAGGTNVGDPGYGGLDKVGPANTKNPSLKVPFGIGFLRVKSSEYSLRMADLATASDLTTGYVGGPPAKVDHVGGIVLGAGGDNSNNVPGTLYEAAMVAGYPTNDVELAVMKNVKAAGYSK
jgi:hypothetical protein